MFKRVYNFIARLVNYTKKYYFLKIKIDKQFWHS